MTTTYSRKSMVLAILPKFSGLLSFLGSSYIFQDVLRHIVTERQRRHHHNHHHFSHGKEKVGVYHRLILGLSVCDLVASIVIMVGTWAIPKEYVGTYMASGTIGTCTVVGIMNELGNMGAPIYNASLCIHYVLVILMGMSEEKIASKGIEWYLHIVPVTFAVVFATLGFIFKLYNGAGSWCWFAPYPPNCSLEPPQPHQTSIIPCTRGHYYHQFRLMHIGIAWVCLVVCSISMFSIYRKVYKQESKVAKYRYNNNSNGGYPSKNGSKSKHSNNNYHNHPNNNNSSQRPNDNDNDESHSNDNNVEANHTNYNQYITSSSSSSRRRPPKKSKSRQIADQGMFFVIVFILTWTFPTITRIFQWLGWSIPLTLNMLFVVFFPLQGFFNALVYLRPKYLKFKKKKEKLAIKKAAAKWKQQQQIKQKITQLFYNNNNSDDNEGDNHNNNNNDDIWDNNNSNSNNHHLDAVSHNNSYHTNNREDENNVPTATTTNNHHHHCLDTNSNDNILLTSDNDDNDSHSFIIRETYQNHHSNNANAFASANADAAVGVGNTAAVDP